MENKKEWSAKAVLPISLSAPKMEAPEIRPITKALEMLLNEIHYLEESVLGLEAKMSPIMPPVGNLATAASPTQQSENRSLMTETLWQATDRLVVCRQRMEYVLNAVEI